MENNIKILIEKYTGDECTEETYIDQLEALIEKANAYAARQGQNGQICLESVDVNGVKSFHREKPLGV